MVVLELDELKREKDKYVTRIFWLGLEVALIFGIPAGLGAYFGLKFDAHYNTERTITFSLLAVAFAFSWFLVIWKYRRITKKINEIDLKIKNYIKK